MQLRSEIARLRDIEAVKAGLRWSDERGASPESAGG
jgi:hypothetical protein